ncbi:MAG: M3 family oligoendopeptidase [Alkalispirochaeta sp.]
MIPTRSGRSKVSADRSSSAAGSVPQWDLSSVYPGLESTEFAGDLSRLAEVIESARAIVADEHLRTTEPTTWLHRVIAEINAAADLQETLESYCYSSYSVDTGDEAAIAALNRVAEVGVPMASKVVEFRDALANLKPRLDELIAGDPHLQGYEFVLQEELHFQKRQLTAAEETLAADLSRSGADAWSRLQETISSTLNEPWETDGEQVRKTVVELRALAFNRDRTVRRRAWEKELAAWQRVETPLAFAINGVKGTTHTLNSRRRWESTLDRSLRQNRLSRRALDALISTMRESLPIFRRYLSAKAHALNLPKLSFYDIFAPVGEDTTSWTYDSAMEFISERISGFDPEQAEFIRRAQREQWIDARPRSGKVGGAYCIDFPAVGESRILANFGGTYDGMSTLAHELGHAWHSHQLRDLPAMQRHYPMTLAETASIFSETLVFYSALESASGDNEIYILEQFLQGSTQVIVDILSRFIFERELMERRAQGEVSAGDLKEMMLSAQKETYGEALNAEELHPYMWAVKGHYYRPELAFYNFPYAFGQLFGLGLYDQYSHAPKGFAQRYRRLLRETGRKDAVSVTAEAGFDIETPEFWRGAMGRIEALVERFVTAVEA